MCRLIAKRINKIAVFFALFFRELSNVNEFFLTNHFISVHYKSISAHGQTNSDELINIIRPHKYFEDTCITGRRIVHFIYCYLNLLLFVF